MGQAWDAVWVERGSLGLGTFERTPQIRPLTKLKSRKASNSSRAS